MELIQKIRNEVERRMNELAKDKSIDLHDTLCRTKELNLLLSFLDTLQEQVPTVDLEQAAVNAYESWKGGTMDDFMRDMEALGKIVEPLRNAK